MIIEVKKKPPLKGVAPTISPRRAREILHQRKLKQMKEEKSIYEMFEKENDFEEGLPPMKGNLEII